MSGDRGSRYRFGPRERGGALAGWRPGQIITVAVGLVFGVLVLRCRVQRCRRGGRHRDPGALRRAGHRARRRSDGGRVAAGGGVLGCPSAGARPARRPTHGCPARAAPSAGRLARHGCGARSGRSHAHCRSLAARRQLRPPRRRRAGPPGGGVGLGAGIVVTRRFADPPRAMGGRIVPRRRGGRTVVLRRRGGVRRGVGLHGLLRRAAARHGFAHIGARCRSGRADPPNPINRGRLRHPRARDGLADASVGRRRRAGRVGAVGGRAGPPAAAHL